MPWITPGRPDLCSGESGSPDPGAHDASARATRRATAASFPLSRLRRPDPRGAIVPRGGCPAAARGRGCEPHPQVPRPAPLRTTPRPKRPSVDGTACTYSESHPECQQVRKRFDDIAIMAQALIEICLVLRLESFKGQA